MVIIENCMINAFDVVQYVYINNLRKNEAAMRMKGDTMWQICISYIDCL